MDVKWQKNVWIRIRGSICIICRIKGITEKAEGLMGFNDNKTKITWDVFYTNHANAHSAQ